MNIKTIWNAYLEAAHWHAIAMMNLTRDGGKVNPPFWIEQEAKFGRKKDAFAAAITRKLDELDKRGMK